VIDEKMRDLLIEHIDGSAPIRVNDPHRTARVNGAIRAGYLRSDRYKHHRSTFITEKGRAALAEALGDWADALARIGGTFPAPPPPKR
jgi:hypothetical protein